jgi:hypothetical protein
VSWIATHLAEMHYSFLSPLKTLSTAHKQQNLPFVSNPRTSPSRNKAFIEKQDVLLWELVLVASWSEKNGSQTI